MFVNRNKEIELLEREYKNKTASFTIIYGRRRVGKTTLIKEFIKDKQAVFFLADTQNELIQISRFKDIVAEVFNDGFLKRINLENWEDIFKYLTEKVKISKKIVIIIDEFQYLVKVNQAVPSIFQRIWDEILKENNIMLILCGSMVSMMYRSTLSYESPLYGRRSSQIKLNPLNFKNFSLFFENKSQRELIELYSIISGIPKYIEVVNIGKDIFDTIEKNILDKNSFLYQEPRFILNEELTETATYFSILEIISKGEHKIGNIAKSLQINTNNLTSFMHKLIELELIEREVPITEDNPLKSKKGLYFIRDNFFRFWFNYVLPYKSYLEMENTIYVLNKVKISFNEYVSSAFEKICMEIIVENPPFEFQKIGRWWDKNEEIDLLVLSDKNILFVECKWWENKVGMNVFYELKRKAKFVNLTKEKQFYAIFSKSGFTKELETEAEKDKSILLFDFN